MGPGEPREVVAGGRPAEARWGAGAVDPVVVDGALPSGLPPEGHWRARSTLLATAG